MPLTKAPTFFRNKSEPINFFKNRFDFNEFFFFRFFLLFYMRMKCLNSIRIHSFKLKKRNFQLNFVIRIFYAFNQNH